MPVSEPETNTNEVIEDAKKSQFITEITNVSTIEIHPAKEPFKVDDLYKNEAEIRLNFSFVLINFNIETSRLIEIHYRDKG